MPVVTTSTANQTLQTGEQIYNTIMVQIEPDLLTTSTVKVDSPETGESDGQYAARMERYRKAFATYERCFEAYVAYLRDESRRTRLDARVSAESKSNAEEKIKAEELFLNI